MTGACSPQPCVYVFSVAWSARKRKEKIMPRIPAAIAVVMLVATCIGFNTARFPVVLEMAAIPTTPSMTKVVICSEASPVSEDSIDTDSSYSYSSDNEYESSNDRQSRYSSYGNDSDSESSRNSYGSYGSHDYDDGSGSSDEERMVQQQFWFVRIRQKEERFDRRQQSRFLRIW